MSVFGEGDLRVALVVAFTKRISVFASHNGGRGRLKAGTALLPQSSGGESDKSRGDSAVEFDTTEIAGTHAFGDHHCRFPTPATFFNADIMSPSDAA
ncbi:unnamed protein product [Heligmosomoides polygyrus]|uniref:Secreted protein n=1 Tax=Heligmosomoides polygyrus TaxID=6339 RepID=A0A183FX65_HELPZ|nr:unnamed protein product [Heligmosomoides polygyrus]